MKATGIVRRIDDLGRVVIPKEIRRTMRIREGDPLEIYTSADGEVIFKKYSPLGELASFASEYAEALSNGTQLAVIICDRDHCIAAAGISKKETLERAVTPELEEIMESRKFYLPSGDKAIFAIADCNKKICAASPIVSAGDITGAVVLLENDAEASATDTDVKLISVASSFLSVRTE